VDATGENTARSANGADKTMLDVAYLFQVIFVTMVYGPIAAFWWVIPGENPL